MIEDNLIVPLDRMREGTRRYHDWLERLERGETLRLELPSLALKRFEKGLSNARQQRQPTYPKKYLYFVRNVSGTDGKVTLTVRLTAKRKP